MPFLLYTNATHQSQVWWWKEDILSNTPYIPWGMIHSIYLDMGTFSGGLTLVQFPLDRLHLCWLLPISRIKVLLPHEGGGKRGWRHTPVSQSSYGMVQRRNIIFPIPAPCHFPCQLLHNCKRVLRLREGQTIIQLVPKQRGSGYHPSLKLLQDNNQARSQLEYELIQEA